MPLIGTGSYLGGLHLELVDGQGVSLQAAGTDRQQLLQTLDVVLNFQHGFGGHPADLLLNMLLLLYKLSTDRRKDKTCLKRDWNLVQTLVRESEHNRPRRASGPITMGGLKSMFPPDSETVRVF